MSAEQIVGCSPVMCQLMERLNTIAASDAPVLVTGEAGTGKQLIARAVHERSRRESKRFVAIDCAAFSACLPDGSLDAAHGGTLLFDDVGDMSPAVQDELLRILHEDTGDVRVIAATRRDLAGMADAGLFGKDLYRRLNAVCVDVPPLRARRGDLPLLTQYFSNKFHRPGTRPARMSSAAWNALSAFGFPGNVRQLGRAIEHATVLAGGGEIDLRHLPADIGAALTEIAVALPRTLAVAKPTSASVSTPQSRFQRLMRA